MVLYYIFFDLNVKHLFLTEFSMVVTKFNLDLKTVQLTKTEFINILIENKLFTTLSDLFNEKWEEDEDFFVYFYSLISQILIFVHYNSSFIIIIYIYISITNRML